MVTRRNITFPSKLLKEITLPCFDAVGSRDGPLLTLLAGVHGCEYSPIAAVREFMNGLDTSGLAGRVVAVPVVNLAAFRTRTPFVTPEDGKNLNRCFPGDPDGTFSEVLAFHLFQQLILPSDYLIDLHAGDMVEELEPFALYDESEVEGVAKGMANAYGVRYVIRQAAANKTVAGSTSAAAAGAGIPAVIAEAGGRGLLERSSVQTHLGGLGNVLRHLGMVEDGPPPVSLETPRHLGDFLWLRSRTRGWWESKVEVGQEVSEGTLLGTLSDLFGRELEWIVAPKRGVTLFITSSPSVDVDGLLLGLGTDQ
jgi:uncharacterized protein